LLSLSPEREAQGGGEEGVGGYIGRERKQERIQLSCSKREAQGDRGGGIELSCFLSGGERKLESSILSCFLSPLREKHRGREKAFYSLLLSRM